MKKIILLIVCALFLCTVPVFSQSWQWARKNSSGCFDYTGNPGTYYVNPFAAADIYGNVYVFGNYYCNEISFGTDTIYATTTALYYPAMYLVKYDSLGNVKWLRNLGTEPPDGVGGWGNLANSVAVDASGNIYISGTCFDSSFTCGSISIPMGRGAFLAKIDSAGNTVWARSVLRAKGSSVQVDCFNNIYVAGSFNDSVVFGSIILKDSTNLLPGIFTAKYDSVGNVHWARGIYGSNLDSYLSNNDPFLTSDKSGNVILESSGLDTIYIDSIILNLTSTHLGSIIAKYDSSGYLKWAIGLKDTGYDITSVATDSLGNIYECGNMLIKFDYSGNFVWAKTFSYAEPSIITINNNNSIIVNGINAAGEILSKYDSSGILIGTKNVIDSGYSTYGGYDVTDLSLCVNGNIYVTGIFDANWLTFGHDTLNSPGGTPGHSGDFIFLAKLGYGYPESIFATRVEAPDPNIYPNPTKGVFEVDFPLISSDARITIRDIYGKVIETNIVEAKLPGKTYFDLSEYPSGIYFINIKSENFNFNKKIILNK